MTAITSLQESAETQESNMTMYSLIEDAQMKALEAANCWFETEQAQELLAKIDAYERASDRWHGERPDVVRAFSDGASEAASDLEALRSEAVDAAADTYSTVRTSDEWLDAWDAAEQDAPTVDQVIQSAQRAHAGDSYLRRFAA